MEQERKPSCIFGPVPSRRLGRSLGIDVVPFKTCTYDCVYCQLGRTTHRTTQRREYVLADEVISQLQGRLAEGLEADYITFSGSGEPTLNQQLGRMIATVHGMTDAPVAVLTNGSLLFHPEVRADLARADLVIPSLDAATSGTWKAVNRPCPELHLEAVLDGLRRFRQEFSGALWLEVLLVRGLNDSAADLAELAAVVEDLHPDRVQLNTVVRPPAEGWAEPLDRPTLERIAATLPPPTEVIAEVPPAALDQPRCQAGAERILALLSRRPCTLEDLAASLGIHRNEAGKYVQILLQSGAIQESWHQGRRFYALPPGS
jgi:wyosine [tRNA(Phe)-imidazoG37] synthetase (radical SAM superfamily)